MIANGLFDRFPWIMSHYVLETFHGGNHFWEKGIYCAYLAIEHFSVLFFTVNICLDKQQNIKILGNPEISMI